MLSTPCQRNVELWTSYCPAPNCWRVPECRAQPGLKFTVKWKDECVKADLPCAAHASHALAKVYLLLPPTWLWAERGDVDPFCSILLFMLCSGFCYVSTPALHCYFGSLGFLVRQDHGSEVEITFTLSLLHPVWCICSSRWDLGDFHEGDWSYPKSCFHVGTGQGIWCSFMSPWQCKLWYAGSHSKHLSSISAEAQKENIGILFSARSYKGVVWLW